MQQAVCGKPDLTRLDEDFEQVFDEPSGEKEIILTAG